MHCKVFTSDAPQILHGNHCKVSRQIHCKSYAATAIKLSQQMYCKSYTATTIKPSRQMYCKSYAATTIKLSRQMYCKSYAANASQILPCIRESQHYRKKTKALSFSERAFSGKIPRFCQLMFTFLLFYSADTTLP